MLFGDSRSDSRPWPPLIFPVFLLVATSLASVAASEQITESTWPIIILIPAALIFFLVAQHFTRLTDIRRLYFTFSAVAIGLAALVLANTDWMDDRSTRAIVYATESPALKVPNDIAFLAVIAPFSVALVVIRPKTWHAFVAVPSLILTVFAIVALNSRTALVTLIISLSAFAALTQAHRRLKSILAYGSSLLGCVLVVDAVFGASLTRKFVNKGVPWDRLELWATAWDAFLKAPWLGHGPGTFKPGFPFWPWHGRSIHPRCPEDHVFSC